MLLLKLMGVWLVLTIGGLVIVLFAPQIFAPLVCSVDEQMEKRTSSISDPRGTAYATDVYCVNESGGARKVGYQIFLPFMGISAVALMLFLLPGMSERRRRKQALIAQAFQNTATDRSPRAAMPDPSRSASPELSDLNARLRELKQRYDQGLITERDYQKAKQSLLDNFTS